MKAKVLKSFVDKKTGQLQTEGSIVEYDKKRIGELTASGFVVESKPDAESL